MARWQRGASRSAPGRRKTDKRNRSLCLMPCTEEGIAAVFSKGIGSFPLHSSGSESLTLPLARAASRQPLGRSPDSVAGLCVAQRIRFNEILFSTGPGPP
jgi:hypothetical protein